MGSVFTSPYKKLLPSYTLDEIAQHNTIESCWIIFDSNVIDATDFLSKHPGGIECILKKAGTDCTEDFNFHRSKNEWKKRIIGTVQNI